MKATKYILILMKEILKKYINENDNIMKIIW